MKDLFKMLLVLVIVTLPLAGCFKSPEERAAEEAAEQISEMFGQLGEVDGLEDLANMDEEDLANSFGAMMEFGAEMEIKDFESQESLSLPATFPVNFVYKNAKVTGVNNSSSGDDLYLDIDFRTTDSSDDVKAFYKALLNDGTWTVNGESIETGYYTISGDKETDNSSESIDVTVYYNDFSKLIDINVYYSAYSY